MNDKPPISKKEQYGQKIREFSLQKQYINLMKTGQKTVEGRINSNVFAGLQIGSKIRFYEKTNPRNYVICEVTEKKSYSTFREMLQAEGVENMLPGITDLDEGVEIYEKIPGYKERCAKNGCLGLKIRVLEQS